MIVNCGLFAIILTPIFLMLGEDLYVVTNKNYDDEGAYPDATTKLEKITAVGERAKRKVHRIKLKFRPDSNGIATASIVEQMREEMHRIEPGSDIVTVLGDGGNGVVLRGKQLLNQEDPAHAADRLFIAPGGTMNLIAKALGVKLEHLPLFLAGYKCDQEVLLRELVIQKREGGEVHIPWAAFSGVGFDGRFLEAYERKSRTNHVLQNVFQAGVDLAPEVLGSNDQFTWHMALAVSQIGLIKFPPDELDVLGKRDFHQIQLGPVDGTAAAIKGIALQVTGLHPAIAKFYWEKRKLAELLDVFPGHATFREIIESVRPRVNNGQMLAHQIAGEFTCHGDGFPYRFKGGADHYEFITLEDAGVKAFSPKAVSKLRLF